MVIEWIISLLFVCFIALKLTQNISGQALGYEASFYILLNRFQLSYVSFKSLHIGICACIELSSSVYYVLSKAQYLLPSSEQYGCVFS